MREQRRVPLLFAVACVVTGLALLALLGAPRQLLALVIAMFVGLIVTLTITLAWKCPSMLPSQPAPRSS